ncbi:MAG: phenylacetate--CoA ligase [Planctomycetota bacterium]|jgi:phenylacetate-CoA ligase|nr:phenylacetate--CoA ligase [Planctomycetota bacterium]
MPAQKPENRVLDAEESFPRERMAALQLERLRKMIDYAKARTPFYEKALAGVSGGDLKSLDDIRRLPVTTKADLRDAYPLGFMAIPRHEIARIHGSSGTTGKMTFVPYSKNDLRNWTRLVARFLCAGGLGPGQLVQISFGYGLFTGGFGLHYGVEEMGSAVVPAASGNTERQLAIIRDLRPDGLVCTPSYALALGEAIRAHGVKPGDLSLKLGFFGGEPWTDEIRRRIEEDTGLFATDNYGLSEVIGPGASGECVERRGMHFSEDHFLVECLDPDTLSPVDEGGRGELVITTLTKEGMPVIRYRTRDIASLNRAPCPCGRTGVRMSRVTGRSDDMLVIRGVNVYPTQIEEALLRVREAAPHYLIEVTRPFAMDEVKVKVEVAPEMFSASMSDMVKLQERLAAAISSVTGIRMTVELVAPHTLERFQGKAKRVSDLRAAPAGKQAARPQ